MSDERKQGKAKKEEYESAFLGPVSGIGVGRTDTDDDDDEIEMELSGK